MRRPLLLLQLLGLLVGPAARAAPTCPNVLLVLDASDSMGQPPDSSTTRSKIAIAKEVLGQVLLGDPDAGIPAPNSGLRFGYTYFPGTTHCASGPTSPLPVANGYCTNAEAASAIGAVTLHTTTPTAATLDAVRQTPELTDTSRARYVLVLTDGAPTCSPDAGGESIGAVAALRADGVQTFVVGFGSVTADTKAVNILNGMAAAGRPAYPDGGAARFFPAANDAELAAALSTVLGQATTELGGSGCDPCLDLNCVAGKRCELEGGCPTCVPDPCAGVSCGAGQFCRPSADGGLGACVGACTQGCPAGQACQDGTCVADHCALGSCASCPAGQAADPDGGCGPDLCAGVRCPSEAPRCAYGSCFALNPDAGAGAADGGAHAASRPHGASASGCSCGEAGGVGALLALGSLGIAGPARRRRRIG